MAKIWEVPAPNGVILEFEQDQEPTRAQFDKAVQVYVSSQSSPGELRRREGAGEIASNEPRFPMGALDAIGGVAPVNLSPTGVGVSTPRTGQETRDYAEANRKVAPFVAAMVSPEALPAAGVVGSGLIRQLARVGLESLTSSAAFEATDKAPDVLSGEKGISEAAIESLPNVAIGTALGPAIYGAARGIGAAYSALKGGRLGAAVADLFRPVEQSAEQVRALRARGEIDKMTGRKIDLGLAETIRSRPSTRAAIQPGRELTEQELGDIQDMVLHLTANTARSGRTTPDISKAVFDVLDPQRQGLNQQVKNAVEQFAQQSVNTINASESAVRGGARGLFPAGRSKAQIGADLGEEADLALQGSQAQWNKAYETAKSLPEYNQVLVDLQPVRDLANRFQLTLVKDVSGNPSVLAGAAVTRPAAGAEVLGQTATLDEARNLVTQLNQSINKTQVLPGLDVRIKAQLADTARKAVQDAVQPYPVLKGALDSANKLYAENIGRFRGSFAEGILKDVGEEGGALPEAIVRSLTGSSAETRFNQFMELLGEGATAGTSRASQGRDLIREAVVANAFESGRKGVGINAGKMFGVVDSIPEKVRNQLFPNYAAMRQLMVKEAALQKVGTPKDAQVFLDQLKLDPTDLQAALSSGDLKTLESFAKKSVQAQKTASEQLASLGLDKLATRDTFDIYSFAIDPNNLPKVSNLTAKLSKSNPEALADVKALYVDDLINRSKTGDVFDPQKFRELIQSPVASTAPGMAPGTTGRASGAYTELTDKLLGKAERYNLIKIADSLGDIKTGKQIGIDSTKSWFHTLFFGYQGGNVMQGTPNSIVNFVGRLLTGVGDMKYALAARMMTDQRLREAAMKPLGEMNVRELNRAVRLTTQLIKEKFGKDSEMYREARDLEDSAPDTSP